MTKVRLCSMKIVVAEKLQVPLAGLTFNLKMKVVSHTLAELALSVRCIHFLVLMGREVFLFPLLRHRETRRSDLVKAARSPCFSMRLLGSTAFNKI